MMAKYFLTILCSVILGMPLPAGAQSASEPRQGASFLEIVAESTHPWTGVAVSREGRIFVNFPRWGSPIPMSVGELGPEGEAVPFPDERWNTWDESADPGEHFICIQSVYVDSMNYLWVLDPANPEFQGVIPGGPKLIKVDLLHNEVMMKITFPEDVVLRESYLNDVRIDNRRNVAFITDSGQGAIIVVDLRTGESRRLLSDHPSTQSEGTPILINGRTWTLNGKVPDVHADGIALSPDGEYLYYHALSGTRLYRIRTSALLDPEQGALLGKMVEAVAVGTGPADGMAFAPDGSLYITHLPQKAILRWRENRGTEVFVRDDALNWPDTLAVTEDGLLYVTTSQIHEGGEPREPYRLYRIALQPQRRIAHE